ncbi:hypothetical protein JCM19237_234 [Photobacterium aphoticum]|uniref:Uncharacterized protein n=1 Tax=Photobacterium aphoticum TaxID=754436 RepID=A0A090QYB2_9GAMM|nr:hypothetical protein JCM19237_234 [Photobacterium aphoticum]
MSQDNNACHHPALVKIKRNIFQRCIYKAIYYCNACKTYIRLR